MESSGRVESSTWYLKPNFWYTESMRFTTPMISSVSWSGAHKQVRVVLSEATNAKQAVQRAAHFMAVHNAQPRLRE